MEKFYLNSKKSNSNSDVKDGILKSIVYIQADLSKCSIKPLNNQELALIESCLLTEQCRVSIVITKELVRLFGTTLFNDHNFSIINDTLEGSFHNNDNNSTITNKYKINYDDQSSYHYLFKVINIGPVHSLANSQFKTKLRADVKIEIIPIVLNESYRPLSIIMSLMSKYLFYCNFLYVGQYYLLKSAQKIVNIKFDKLNSSSTNRGLSMSLLFLDDSFRIIDDFVMPDSFNSVLTNINDSYQFKTEDEFIGCLSGTLVEKRLKSNCNLVEYDLNETLMNHFDLIVPNKEFKLVVKVHNSIKNKIDFVTVYFDTRFSIYKLCILPGMEIQIFNLIKKSDRVYKSNTSICPSFIQTFNLLNISNKLENSFTKNQEPNAKTSRIVTNLAVYKKRTLHENLNDLNHIFTCLNEAKTDSIENSTENGENDSNFNLNLLFKGPIFDQTKSTDSIKLLAQIIRIYELNLKLKCKSCNYLANSCNCTKQSNCSADSFKLEFSISLLVDDHTSILKLNYSNQNHDLKSNQSNFFGPISNYLKIILLKYLNEIKMPNIPAQMNQDENQANFSDPNSKIYSAIRDKLNSDTNIETKHKAYFKPENNQTINNSIINANDASFLFDNYVKLDIYKTLYDYFYYSVLDSHQIFYIDLNELSNIREMQKLSVSYATNLKLRNFKSKRECGYFKLSEMNSNEQFKSILNLKCHKFVPVDIELNEI